MALKTHTTMDHLKKAVSIKYEKSNGYSKELCISDAGLFILTSAGYYADVIHIDCRFISGETVRVIYDSISYLGPMC